MDAPVERRVTRAKNVNQHPGLTGTMRKRRTKEEIERDNALLQEKKDMIAKKKALSIARVAHLEDRMAIKDSGAESAHPRDAMGSEAPDRDELCSQKNEPKKASRKQPANDKPIVQGSLRQAKEKRKRVETEDEAGSERRVSEDDMQEVVVTYVKPKGSKAAQVKTQVMMQEVKGAPLPIQQKVQPTTVKQVPMLEDTDEELTELEPTPKKGGRGLKRSYAVDNFATPAARGKYGQQAVDEEYELVTERESDAPEPDDVVDLDDDDPTPKKKKSKIAKVPVREAVGSSRQQPEPRRESTKVCEDTDTSTKTGKTKYGPIANWAAQVAQAKSSEFLSMAHTASSTTAVSARRTTSTSNAIVIPTKNEVQRRKQAKTEPPPNTGFLEEDEAAEREAALSSPVKGGQRLSNEALVKVEPTTPLPKRVIGRREKFTNASLPSGCHDNAAWRRIFIPTYLQYLGSRDAKDAWSIDDNKISLILQKIWDHTYGAKVRQKIAADGAVFFIANQRVCEWRSGFASAALTIVQAFYDDNDFETDESHQAFARDALENYSFLYRKVSMHKNEPKCKGIFGGALVTQTLAAHYNAICGATNPIVLGIGNLSRPSVALALSAAAAERALTLWRDGFISCETVAAHKAGKRSSPILRLVNKVTGKESTRTTDFNQSNWGAVTSSYIQSIKKNLSSDIKFDAVIADARSSVKVSQRGDATATAMMTTGLDEEYDERAQLSDDESDCE